MTTRSYYIVGAFVLIGTIGIASFLLFYRGAGSEQEKDSKRYAKRYAELGSPKFREYYESLAEKHGQRISTFLGLTFPALHHPGFGSNPYQSDVYLLTEEDKKQSIEKLQKTLQETTEVSVIIDCKHAKYNSDDDTYSPSYLLSYDTGLVEELCKQLDLMGETTISPIPPPCMCDAHVPDIIFTLRPSKIEICYLLLTDSSHDIYSPFLFIRSGIYRQCWKGDFGDGFYSALLDSRIQSGETVRSKWEQCVPDYRRSTENDKVDE
jgi:hypothetical protein